MKLTDAQRGAVKFEGNTLLVACPGSGKTRAILAKLLTCADQVRGSPRRVACITYTNAAVHEIEQRLRVYGGLGDEDLCEVSTIHAFCINNVLRHFYWRVPEYKNGFSVLAPDSDRFKELVEQTCERHGITGYSVEDFELLNRNLDGEPVISSSSRLTAAIVHDFWETLRREQFIDFANIIYHSYRLLIDWPSIADTLASRFAWVLVDEFQDTTALQVAVLNQIAGRKKSRFFLVGDPHQSIFGFAGAKSDLMDTFAAEIEARTDFQLLANWRSSRKVISHAEQLRPRKPPMEASGDDAGSPIEPQYHHSASTIIGLTTHFLPALAAAGIPYGEAAILAPSWFTLLPISREFRSRGIPIVGPGARPYKRNNLFALLAEQVCAYIEEPNPKYVRQAERELHILLLNATGAEQNIFSYKGRLTVFSLLRAGAQIRDQNEKATDWLRATADRFETILNQDGFLPDACIGMLTQSVEDMIRDMGKNKTADLAVKDMGLFANPDKSMKLLTMHKSKGREFDAVAIVDLHDGKVPHRASSGSAEQIDESRRLLYVAITRARRLLMYFTDSSYYRNTPSRFLKRGELGLIP